MSLCRSNGVSWADSNVLPAREVLLKLKSAASKALELDDSLAEAHTSLAWAKFHDWDWAGAAREFQRAIELNPATPPPIPGTASIS